MGRVGIEPTTLGLRVRPDELKRATPSGKPLLGGAFHFATNCYKLHASETNRYAHRYAQLLAGSPGFGGLCPPILQVPDAACSAIAGDLRSREITSGRYQDRYQVGRDDDRLTSAARAGTSRGSRSLPSMGGRVLDLFAGAGGLAEGLAESSSRKSATEQRGRRQVSRRRPLRSDPRAGLIRSTPRG
jgi:hypothetical protein